MPILTIRLEYVEDHFNRDPEVAINLTPLEVVDGAATADLEENILYYVASHFVVNAKTSLTLHLVPPEGHVVCFRDYPDDKTSTITWEVGRPNRGYFRDRRIFLKKEAGPEAGQ